MNKKGHARGKQKDERDRTENKALLYTHSCNARRRGQPVTRDFKIEITLFIQKPTTFIVMAFTKEKSLAGIKTGIKVFL